MSDTTTPAPVLYIPHGGGPLPLLGDPGHADLTRYLVEVGQRLPRPDAILVVSAHWEAGVATLGAVDTPELIYDYYGFPEESYAIRYPAPGSPALRQQVTSLLTEAGLAVEHDDTRGYDHGLFVPLKLMFPEADIPCLQLSLLDSLDPEEHLALGAALAPLRDSTVLIFGSGLSFHNMGAFRGSVSDAGPRSATFDNWLRETCCNAGMDEAARHSRLANWSSAPDALFCHPREEHLIPLHVCMGAAHGPAVADYQGTLAGAHVSSFLWQ